MSSLHPRQARVTIMGRSTGQPTRTTGLYGSMGHKPRVPMIAFAEEDLVVLCRDLRYVERSPGRRGGGGDEFETSA